MPNPFTNRNMIRDRARFSGQVCELVSANLHA
jgi:hypothetical protein